MAISKPTDDLILLPTQIVELENSTRLENFFADLGYERATNKVLEKAGFGLTDNLQEQVRSIRLIATGREDDSEIQIVLLEMRSLSMTHTQAIAQCLRQKPVRYLLIQTVNYEVFEFVLLDRVRSEAQVPGSGAATTIRYIIHPRPLTINRNDPGTVVMRVLKRFTYTEMDDLAQWDKLRSAYTLADWSEPDFNNRALFSDYYLKHRLSDADFHPIWDEDVRAVGGKVKALIAGAREKYAKQPEAKTRTGLIEPLWKEMGFAYTYRISHDGTDEGIRGYSLADPGKPDKPLAIALTYQWGRNLDTSDPERDAEHPTEIPGALVVTLLENAAAPWVILTNGKLWRLYSAIAANKITNYYEVDLEEAVYAADRDPVAAFKYWWLIFRRAAFSDGLLEKIVAESQAYARQIGKQLKDRIFEEIFGYFAGGFIAHLRDIQNDTDQGEPEAQPVIDLDLAYQATMTFLYRLMFILYAESRELLPIKQESGYGPRSLKAIKEAIARHAGTIENETRAKLEVAYDAQSTDLYTRIQTLYAAIDKGDQALNLPVYNGGLFSTETDDGAFLEQHAIPDLYLAIGLDRLARDVDDKTHALAFIDYKSLGVRELGSIYEGLLEFKLRIAAEDLVIVRDGKREIYLSRAKAEKDKKNTKAIIGKVRKGNVYIENTKQERKATGSYYTPDYIVNYIVEHTVGPVLDEKFAALRPRLHLVQKRYRQHRDLVNSRKDKQSAELFWTSDPEAIPLADDCLNIRVLDPAMGSGHFLVAAVDFISNRLIDFLNGWTENPVWALLERTRAEILTDLQAHGVSVDESKLTRVVLLKRSVLKRCVYGVDLNGMAVELAKVSLWLDAFTLGAPLSFLDHHLKHGNSLIGARVTEVQDYLRVGEQTLDMFSGSEFAGVMLATDLMRQVSFQSDNTIAQARQSKEAFRQASDHLARYKRVLDVYTARWFGAADVVANGKTANTKAKKGKTDNVKLFLKQPDVQAWLKDPTLPVDSRLIPAKQIGQVALSAAQEKLFFHWELEFPEVFFAPSIPGGQDIQIDPNGGFDAVIGNPPYIRIQTQVNEDPAYYDTFVTATQSYDIYLLFVERGIYLLSKSGRQGFIIPNKFSGAEYGIGLRRVISQGKHLFEYINFGSNQIFEGATTYSCILILAKSAQPIAKYFKVNDITLWLKGSNVATSNIDVLSLSEAVWKFSSESDTTLSDKLHASIWPLGQIANIFVGLQTSADNIFIFDLVENRGKKAVISSQALNREMELETALLHPLVSGSDVEPYSYLAPEQYILFPYQVNFPSATLIQLKEITANYPLIAAYLKANQKALEMREGGKFKDDAWFRFGRSQNLGIQQQPKICVPRLVDRLHGTLDKNGEIYLDNVDVGGVTLVSEYSHISLYYVLAIVNSRAMAWYFPQISTPFRGGYYSANRQYLEKVPIPKLQFITSSERRIQLEAEARTLSAQADPLLMLTFTAERLTAGETDVIHDLLAALAEQMIELNKSKQAEMKHFLTWLEAQLQIRPDRDGKTGIDSLKKKSFIQDYLGDYQKGAPELSFDDAGSKNTLWYCLHENRTRFPTGRLGEIKAAIHDEYERSLALLLPIKRELSRTDSLIDRVVYQLYGLTDEEIRLIEYPGLAQAAGSARTETLKEPDIETQPEAVLADKIIEKIEPAADQYFARVDESGIESGLRAEINGWETLPANVQKFLRTGETLLVRNNIEDYSGVMIYYAKAVEALLMTRWFEPFRQTHNESDVYNEQSFKPYMRHEKPLTLGSVPFLLFHEEVAFRAFLAEQYPPDRYNALIDKNGFRGVLKTEFINRFRNGSAHTEDQSEADARAARSWALQVIFYV